MRFCIPHLKERVLESRGLITVARIFQCGFEHGATIVSTPGWEISVNTTGTARTGQGGLDNGGGTEVFLALGASLATVTWGLGFIRSSASSAAVMRFYDGSTVQLTAQLTATGGLNIYRGTTAGTLLGSLPNGTFQTSVWYGLVIRATIHSATGAVDVWVNGGSSPALSLTGVNTQNTANAWCTRLSSGGDFGGLRIDDVYVNDASGGVSTGNDGDLRIYRLDPNADGSFTDFTASAGNRFQCVDDGASPNDDTDYVSSSTAGQKVSFALTDLPVSTGTITGVQVFHRVRKDEGGTRESRAFLKSGGSTQNEATESLSVSYQTYKGAMRTIDPATGVAWTIAGVNGLEIGEEIVT